MLEQISELPENQFRLDLPTEAETKKVMNRLIAHRNTCAAAGKVADFDSYLTKNGGSHSGSRSGVAGPLETFIQACLAKNIDIKPAACYALAMKQLELAALLKTEEEKTKFTRRVGNARQRLKGGSNL